MHQTAVVFCRLFAASSVHGGVFSSLPSFSGTPRMPRPSSSRIACLKLTVWEELVVVLDTLLVPSESQSFSW